MGDILEDLAVAACEDLFRALVRYTAATLRQEGNSEPTFREICTTANRIIHLMPGGPAFLDAIARATLDEGFTK